jgi:alpha-glucosidase (family GH31 glycosyl hydrolase)
MATRPGGAAAKPIVVSATVRPETRPVLLERGALTVEVSLRPVSVTVRRAGAPVIERLGAWCADGLVADRFVQLTEGVIPRERLEAADPVQTGHVVDASGDGVVLGARTRSGRDAEVSVSLPASGEVVVGVRVASAPLRVGALWEGRLGERFVGLGARHGERLDQSGRCVRLGADRRYTGPDCPDEMAELGGVPQGDYAPAPWAISSRGYALWLDTAGEGVELDLRGPTCVSVRSASGPLALHLALDATPAARLRRYLRAVGFPALLPEWGYGHWKSRDVYEHQDVVLDDLHGYRWHRIPLDAIVIDSPWETQYNTWAFNPHQFPDPEAMVARLRAAGVRTVVWITPWVNLESVDGQMPPDPASRRMHREPAANYAPAAAAGHFVRSPGGEPHVARWWMGTGSVLDFTNEAAEAWWRGLARGALELGVAGIKADDGEGYYFPSGVRFADGRDGARAAWAYGELYRACMQRALDEVHPGDGVLFGRSGWSGQQRLGVLWGGDQVSDFWSLRALVVATLSAAASGFSNWSHDVGGYLGSRLVDRCPRELLIRWAQLGCFTPLMQAHGRLTQEAWTYDRETLELFRAAVLLHERLVPYVRAAAATAARSGLPIVRPLCLLDPADPRGWTLGDAFGYGPALWVAPVLQDGARERRVAMPRGEWIDLWSGACVPGGGEVVADAPLARIPVWVRSGSILVTHPVDHVAAGLGDTPERERPLEATLWGEPRCGRATVRLADGTGIRWNAGRWSVSPERLVRFAQRG